MAKKNRVYLHTPERKDVLDALPLSPGVAVTPSTLARARGWSVTGTIVVLRGLANEGLAGMRRRRGLLAYWRLPQGGGA